VSTPSPLRVGVIGAGLIAQVMHLPNLRQMADRFDVVCVCDASRAVAQACARRFGIERAVTDWTELIGQDLDAVVVASSGSHEPMAVAAAEAGRHVFVEKPIAYSVAEAEAMVEAAAAAGVVLMVGYPKRYDPAYRAAAKAVQALEDLRFVRVTTAESPAAPYIGHQPVESGPPDPDLARAWQADRAERVRAALGGIDGDAAKTYEAVLLDTLVHELNLLRGFLGEPSSLRFVSARADTVTIALDFAGIDCVIAWIDLPGIARYEMELCFYDPAERIRLAFPSPYLRNVPTTLERETGDSSGPSSAASREILSYASPFALELEAFHRAVTEGVEPETSGLDATRDIALCRSVVACMLTARPVEHPSDPAIWSTR
jgi:predicted dehydrogenase